jgi:hypothetical protein
VASTIAVQAPYTGIKAFLSHCPAIQFLNGASLRAKHFLRVKVATETE